MTDNFNDTFYNPAQELEDKYSNEIHLHRVSRGTKKSDIIVQGLVFKTNEETKTFVSLITKKFGISGCCKMMKDYDTKNNVFIFSGDKRDDIVNILVKTYNKDENFIKIHG